RRGFSSHIPRRRGGWRSIARHHVIAKVAMTARFSESDLMHPLTETGATSVVIFGKTFRTRHPLFIVRMCHVGRQKRATAGVAHLMRAGLESMSNRDTLVKDKAFALPLAVGFWHLFEVFQN